MHDLQPSGVGEQQGRTFSTASGRSRCPLGREKVGKARAAKLDSCMCLPSSAKLMSIYHIVA